MDDSNEEEVEEAEEDEEFKVRSTRKRKIRPVQALSGEDDVVEVKQESLKSPPAKPKILATPPPLKKPKKDVIILHTDNAAEKRLLQLHNKAITERDNITDEEVDEVYNWFLEHPSSNNPSVNVKKIKAKMELIDKNLFATIVRLARSVLSGQDPDFEIEEI